VNKTKIEYVDYTWNPVTGCKHGCSYCYARRIAERFKGTKAWPNGFEPTFHPERLQEPGKVKTHSRIFVGSMADCVGAWVPREWIDETLQMTRVYPWHTYLFLTKNPSRYKDFDFPPNCWIGTSIETQEAANKRVPELLRAEESVRFLSVDPPTGQIDLSTAMHGTAPRGMNRLGFADGIGQEAFIQWVVIGAQTGKGAVKPKADWVESLITQCQTASVRLFLKDNLRWPETIQQYPQGVE
jgi:protein gp37